VKSTNYVVSHSVIFSDLPVIFSLVDPNIVPNILFSNIFTIFFLRNKLPRFTPIQNKWCSCYSGYPFV